MSDYNSLRRLFNIIVTILVSSLISNIFIEDAGLTQLRRASIRVGVRLKRLQNMNVFDKRVVEMTFLN